LEKTRALIGQLEDYAQENWPRSDVVAELPSDVDALATDVGRLVPQKRGAPIPENEVLSRLEDTRQLVERLQRLDKRVGNVRQRLSDLKETERLAVSNLHNARAAFNQIQYIISSNAFLTDVADQEATLLDNEALALLEELESEKKGVIEKTARSVTSLLGRMENSANRWLDKLTGDLRESVTDLSRALTALDAIAGLDEPSVAEARRILSASGKFSLDDRRAKSSFPLGELGAEFKRRSDYWQSCVAAAAALAEVEEYVMASYEEAAHYRQQAQDHLAEVSTWLRQTRDWPPSSISLDEERQEIQQLDERWKSLKDKRLRALALVQQYGNFSAKYQSLAVKISQGAERADQEQAQVEALEIELSELAQIWEDHRYEYHDYPEVDRDIRDLLNTIEHELTTIRRQYKQKTKNYKQVLRSLKDLNKRVKYYQVALDGDHALDASGRVIRRR
jgi:hypothetical protein